MRIDRLPESARAWILGRARTGYPYPKIARQLARSVHKITLSQWAVKRVVARDAPELAAQRTAAWRRGGGKTPMLRLSAEALASVRRGLEQAARGEGRIMSFAEYAED